MVLSPPLLPQTYHSLRFDCIGNENFERNWRFRTLERLKGLYVKEVTLLLIWKASLVAFNLHRFPRRAANEIISTQLPTPSTIVRFEWLRKGTRLVHWNDKSAAWVNLKECLITQRISQANEETPTLMKDNTRQTVIKAGHHQNPPLQPKGRTAGFWEANVGSENLWPWPTLY